MILFALAFALTTGCPRHAQAAEVDFPLVYREVAILRAEIEALRLVIGRPAIDETQLRVDGAAPHAVYFQARAVFEKTDLLAVEFVGKSVKAPETPVSQITPYHVLAIVSAARERFREIRVALGEAEPVEIPEVDASKTSSETFMAIIHANRQLNRMLARQIQPGDVYPEVSLAEGYASRLAAAMSVRPAEVPVFEARKQPIDVYRRLLFCFETLQAIAARLGFDTLDVSGFRDDRSVVVPDDVFDLAVLLVSELRFLSGRFETTKPLRKYRYPGRIFPSRVFQRAGQLEGTLTALRQELDSRSAFALRDGDVP